MGKKAATSRSRNAVPMSELRELCFDSIGKCGNPDCNELINIQTSQTGAITTVGQMAHIIAAQNNGPRGDANFPPGDRERYRNLILLCQKCHPVVDNPANFSIYSSKLLQEWKQAQIEKRRNAIARTRENPEIEVLANLLNTLATADPQFHDDFTRTDISTKLKINKFGQKIANTIARNVIYVKFVTSQILQVERSSPKYGEMIQARMKSEWLLLLGQGIESDNAYEALRNRLMFGNGHISSEGIVDIVLAYFFQLCSIMHKD